MFDIGGSYFVSDGHKRVAVAREMGIASIDAEVIRLETGYELPADVDIRQLIHTQQHRLFMEQTGLEESRMGWVDRGVMTFDENLATRGGSPIAPRICCCAPMPTPATAMR